MSRLWLCCCYSLHCEICACRLVLKPICVQFWNMLPVDLAADWSVFHLGEESASWAGVESTISGSRWGSLNWLHWNERWLWWLWDYRVYGDTAELYDPPSTKSVADTQPLTLDILHTGSAWKKTDQEILLWFWVIILNQGVRGCRLLQKVLMQLHFGCGGRYWSWQKGKQMEIECRQVLLLYGSFFLMWLW